MTEYPVLILRVVESDSPDFAALSAAFEAELEDRYPELGEDESSPVQDLFVAVIAYGDDVPLGCGALRELEPGIAEVKRMFVAPQARRLGVARRVLGALEEQAHMRGFSAVRLGTGVRQPEAVALYESYGYHRIPLFGEYEGAELCVCYEKVLG